MTATALTSATNVHDINLLKLKASIIPQFDGYLFNCERFLTNYVADPTTFTDDL